MYATAAPDVHKLVITGKFFFFFFLPCEMAEPWWICFFVYLFTDHCMQSWNAAFFYWLFIVGGEKIFWVWALNFTRVRSGQTISGTSRVRASILSPCRPLVESEVSPVTLYTNQSSTHKSCFFRHYMQGKWKWHPKFSENSWFPS